MELPPHTPPAEYCSRGHRRVKRCVRLDGACDQNGAMLDQQSHPARFVRLTTVGDVNTARILAARLESEGIEVRIHGDALGPYPMTIGSFAETQLWVLSDRVEEASRLLLDAEINALLPPVDAETDETPRLGMPIELRVVALIVGVVLAALWILRIVAMY